MYQSRSFHRGYQKIARQLANGGDPFRVRLQREDASFAARNLSGAARYYQLGIEAAILDAFGC